MLTQARLKELLSYNPLTGEFTNLVSGKGRKPVGAFVGSTNGEGYTTSMIDGRNYLHHRLAWMYSHGYMPPEIDHKDRVRANNALLNLRPATRPENSQNTVRVSVERSGASGWRARIKANGVRHHVGCFATREEAVVAYLAAKARLHTFQPAPRANV